MGLQWTCFLIFIWINYAAGWTEQTAERLLDDILGDDYLDDVLPVCGHNNTPVTVIVDMSIRNILQVDEPAQIMIVSIWARWWWTDCRLTWNASDYDGLDKILLAAERLWVPDINILHSVSGNPFGDMEEYEAHLYSNGTVFLTAPCTLRFTCQMRIKFFPYDQQICEMRLTSWAHNGAELIVTNASAEADLSVFTSNGEFELVSVPIRPHSVYYHCCPEPFTDVTFYLIMKRSSLFYIFNLVSPCALLTFISLLIFYLPAESGEKVALGLAVLLTVSFFLMLVSDNLPPTSESIPVISMYFVGMTVLVCFECIMTVFVVTLHNRGHLQGKVPYWVHVFIFRCMAPCMCYHIDVEERYPAGSKEEEISELTEKTSLSGSVGRLSYKKHYGSHYGSYIFGGDECEETEEERSGILKNLLWRQVKLFEGFHELFMQQQKDEAVATEWQQVAMVMDRLFLIIFALMTLIVSVTVLLDMPPELDLDKVLK